MNFADFASKLVAMATSLERSETKVGSIIYHLPFDVNLTKIGPVDPEIIGFQEIIKNKKERN